MRNFVYEKDLRLSDETLHNVKTLMLEIIYLPVIAQLNFECVCLRSQEEINQIFHHYPK